MLPEQYMAITPLVMFVAGLMMSGILKFAVKRVGLKITFICSCIVGIGMLHCKFKYNDVKFSVIGG